MATRDDRRCRLQQINDGVLTMSDVVLILLGAAGGLVAAVLLPRVYNFAARVVAKYRKPSEPQ